MHQNLTSDPHLKIWQSLKGHHCAHHLYPSSFPTCRSFTEEQKVIWVWVLITVISLIASRCSDCRWIYLQLMSIWEKQKPSHFSPKLFWNKPVWWRRRTLAAAEDESLHQLELQRLQVTSRLLSELSAASVHLSASITALTGHVSSPRSLFRSLLLLRFSSHRLAFMQPSRQRGVCRERWTQTLSGLIWRAGNRSCVSDRSEEEEEDTPTHSIGNEIQPSEELEDPQLTLRRHWTSVTLFFSSFTLQT